MYQVCDWKMLFVVDVLLFWYYIGEGVIDFGFFICVVVVIGYDCDIEVEIFNVDVWVDVLDCVV